MWFVVRYFCWLMAASVLVRQLSTARIVLGNRDILLPFTALCISIGLAGLSIITAVTLVEEEYERRGFGSEIALLRMTLTEKAVTFCLGCITGACWLLACMLYSRDSMLMCALFCVCGLVLLLIELGLDKVDLEQVGP